MANCVVVTWLLCVITQTFAAHNLIETVPLCYMNRLCTEYGQPGQPLSIHPNAQERTEFMLRNIARLFPEEYLSSKYGKYILGTRGTATRFHSDPRCGTAALRPLYFDATLNELARFHVWDTMQCSDPIGHDTCPDPNGLCGVFELIDSPIDSCSFTARATTFLSFESVTNVSTDGITEDTWFANIGFGDDSHCLSVFDPDFVYQGIGIIPGTNLVNTVYAKHKSSPTPSYPIVDGAHFDEKTKISKEMYDSQGNHMVFMAQYFDANGDSGVVQMYLLHQNKMHVMDRIFGNMYSGFYSASFPIDSKDSCKPYAFVVFTTDLKIYRLPEDVRYFFATTAIGNSCNANHFYNDPINRKWVANGSPDIYDLDLIVNVNNSVCNSCGELDRLSHEYNDWILSVDIGMGQSRTTTATPSTSIPSRFPTKIPSLKPSANPTRQPSRLPTHRPTMRPTINPTRRPTRRPTKRPTMRPSEGPTEIPTAAPSNAPLNTNPVRFKITPTDRPSQPPSTKPTESPSESPTENDSEDSNANGMEYRIRRKMKKHYFENASESEESDS